MTLSSYLAVFALEREFEQQMGFVAETFLAAGFELRADLHQLGFGLAVCERLFALFQLVVHEVRFVGIFATAGFLVTAVRQSEWCSRAQYV